MGDSVHYQLSLVPEQVQSHVAKSAVTVIMQNEKNSILHSIEKILEDYKLRKQSQVEIGQDSLMLSLLLLHQTYAEHMSETVEVQKTNYCLNHLDRHQLVFGNTLSTLYWSTPVDELVDISGTSTRHENLSATPLEMRFDSIETETQTVNKCRELRAGNTIRDAAVRRLDKRVLALLSRDLVATEGHYHRKCYRNYTRPEKGQPDTEEDDVDIAKRARVLIGLLIKDYQTVRKDLETVESNADDSLVSQAALALHNAIKSQDNSKA
ncbi:hypothetical protein GQR58_008273 [Nymphon striatum]|nr:hypothetical protein GQR58_008273 [Nymphon striatum]